jgi:hypothetical protein
MILFTKYSHGWFWEALAWLAFIELARLFAGGVTPMTEQEEWDHHSARCRCSGALTAAWIALQWRTRLALEETNCLSDVSMSKK